MFSAFLLILCFLLFFISYRLCGKYDPARIFASIWILQIAFVLLFCQGFLKFEYYGLLYILILSAFFIFGSCYGTIIGSRLNYRKRLYTIIFNDKKAFWLLIILFILAFINPVLALYKQGFNLFSLFDFEELLVINNSMAVERYANNTGAPSLLNQLFLVFSYTSPLYGGYCYLLLPVKRRKWCVFTIFPALFITLTQAVKMGLISSVLLWLSGFIVCMIVHHIPIKVDIKYITRMLLGTFLLLLLLFVSMMFRTGEFDREMVSIVGQKFVVYAFGHLPAFDLWFTTQDVFDYSYGSKTFYGITNFIGIVKREQGVFQEVYNIGKDNFDGTTNVYTVFRILIEDFGYIGSCIVFFMLGFLSRISICCIHKNIFSYFDQVILMAVYSFIFWSFVTSLFAYTSYIAMFCLMFILLYISYSKRLVS